MAGLTQLYDPEFLFRSNTFTSFVITWLIRYADPRKAHPKPIVEYVFGLPPPLYPVPHSIYHRLPLPKEVPLDFRVLPEHILEDVIDYLFFAVRYALVPFVIKRQLKVFRHGPSSLELTGKEEVLIFTITFMLSTWWIKNPFLKNKIIDVCLIFLVSFCSLTALQILFCSCFTYKGQSSLLGSLLNSHPLALKYLMPALTHFYIGTTLLYSINNVWPET